MAEKNTVEPVETGADAALKSSLYGKALTTLKAKHKDEFDSILAGLYNEKGLTYTPRLTPEERKREQLATLAAELGMTITDGQIVGSV